jgi:hypothetical protein
MGDRHARQVSGGRFLRGSRPGMGDSGRCGGPQPGKFAAPVALA